jgi:hypothetical protein
MGNSSNRPSYSQILGDCPRFSTKTNHHIPKLTSSFQIQWTIGLQQDPTCNPNFPFFLLCNLLFYVAAQMNSCPFILIRVLSTFLLLFYLTIPHVPNAIGTVFHWRTGIIVYAFAHIVPTWRAFLIIVYSLLALCGIIFFPGYYTQVLCSRLFKLPSIWRPPRCSFVFVGFFFVLF